MKRILWLTTFVCVPAVLFSAEDPAPRAARVQTNGKAIVRGQPSTHSEIVTRLESGATVSILDEIRVEKPKAGEPAAWYKIALPPQTKAWVHSSFIDSETKAVLPKRLNLRSGPGENYSVIGRIEKGTRVEPANTRDNWLEIAAPPGSYAYIAADLVKPEAAEEPAKKDVAARPPAPEPEIVSKPVAAEPPPPALPGAAKAKPAAETTPPAPAPVPEPVKTEPVVAEAPKPPAPRIVVREGLVSSSYNIQSPSFFELKSVRTKDTINYLYTTDTNLNLKQFRGKRVEVTGEEKMDRRWTKTPVLDVQTLRIVE